MVFHPNPAYRYPAIVDADMRGRQHRHRVPSVLVLIAAFRRFVIIPTAIFLLIPTFYYLATFPSPRPKVSVEKLYVTDCNATSTRDASFKLDGLVRVEQHPLSLSVRCYESGSVSVAYPGVTVADGVSPEFCQWSGRVTVFQTVLTGSNIVLSDAKSDEASLVAEIKLPSRFADVIARCPVVKTCSQLKALPCAVEEKISYRQRAQRELLSSLLILSLWALIMSILIIDLFVFLFY